MDKIQIVLIIIAFLLAGLLTFVFTPVAKLFAYRVGAIDVPKDSRRMHKHPIPRLGGIAIFSGFLLSVLCLTVDFIDHELRGILLGALIIVVLGVVDDVMALKPLVKGLPQFLAVFLPVVCGVRIERIPNFGWGSDAPYIELPLWLQFGVSMIWIMALLNAVNLIDGLDGLAAGVSTIMSLCVAAVGILMQDFKVALVAVALAGSCMGFLPYNFNPAKMFMGDTGAMFIGYMLGCLSVQGMFKVYSIVAFAVPFLILGLPIFDMGFAAIRRILSGRSPFSADKMHLHHKLIAIGMTQKQAVAILYVISAVLGLLAVILTGEGFGRALVLLGLVFLIVIIGCFMLYQKTPKNIDEEDASADTEESAK